LRSTNWLASHPTNFWALQRQARDRIADKNWSEAKEITDKLVRLAPDLSGAESPWLLAAQVQRGLGNTNAERAALEHVAATDGDALEVFSRLTDLALAAHDAKAVRTNAQRVLAVNPLIAMPHRALADAAVILNEDDLVIRESRVLLQLDPVDPASIHLQLGRSLHRRGDDVRAKRHVLQALEEAPRFRAAHELLREIQRRESSVAAPQKTAELPRNKLLP
jgi:tetratricopeptide (TPR) repeat protein